MKRLNNSVQSKLPLSPFLGTAITARLQKDADVISAKLGDFYERSGSVAFGVVSYVLSQFSPLNDMTFTTDVFSV